MSVYLLNSSVLLSGGGVATHAACCCSCAHSISFSVKFDQDEIDFDSSSLMELYSVGRIYDLEVSSFGWSIGSAAVGVSFVADTWYDVSVVFDQPSTGSATVTLCVNGTCSTGSIAGSLTNYVFDTLRIGSLGGGFFGAVAHRSYKNISAVGVGSESAFHFPADSFDSLTTGATITTESGDTVLRIDSDHDPAYGEEIFANPWVLSCPGACCVDDVCYTATSSECDGISGVYQGYGSSCDTNPCPSGACCDGAICNVTGPLYCASIGGDYYDGIPCDPNPCPEPPPSIYCCSNEHVSTCVANGECGSATGLECPEDEDCGPAATCVHWHIQDWRLEPSCESCLPDETCVATLDECRTLGLGDCCYDSDVGQSGSRACPE